MSNPHSRVHCEIDRAFKEAVQLDVDAKEMKWIIFSDHHRGRRDGADDFLACEETYIKALKYYLKEGYTLCLLGDVEEFWENSMIRVLTQYRNILELEKEFYDVDRLHRIWGNHDDSWQLAGKINKHLGWLFPRIRVSESIVLRLKSGLKQAEILLIHGHQGTLESDRFALISRFFVRVFWRNFQRLFRVPLSTPSNNLELKSEHDEAMYQWAAANDNILISGHTHHPVFMSFTHADELQHQLAELIQKCDADPTEQKRLAVEKMRENLLTVQLDEGRSIKRKKRKPLYFNSGCCSFKDGDITGLELANGRVSLVKWSVESDVLETKGSTSFDFLLDNPVVEVANKES